jgi:hypothetical protein
MLQLDLVMCNSHPSGTGFEVMGGGGHEEQLRLGTMRCHGRLLVKMQPQLMAQD